MFYKKSVLKISQNLQGSNKFAGLKPVKYSEFGPRIKNISMLTVLKVSCFHLISDAVKYFAQSVIFLLSSTKYTENEPSLTFLQPLVYFIFAFQDLQNLVPWCPPFALCSYL